jgi:hypothetical protein
MAGAEEGLAGGDVVGPGGAQVGAAGHQRVGQAADPLAGGVEEAEQRADPDRGEERLQPALGQPGGRLAVGRERLLDAGQGAGAAGELGPQRLAAVVARVVEPAAGAAGGARALAEPDQARLARRWS